MGQNTTTSILRSLAVTAGVVGLHLAAVHGLWDASSASNAEDAPTEDSKSALVEGTVLPPVSVTAPAVLPKKPQQSGRTPKATTPAAESTAVDAAQPTADTPTELPAEPEPQVVAATDPPPAEQAEPPQQLPETKPAVQTPAVNMQWQYEVSGSAKGFKYHATATMRWSLEQDRYETQLTLGAFLVGSRSQLSQGRITANGLQPERFTDKARRERQLQFDWQTQTVQSPEQTGHRTVAPGTQDRLSVFMQLASLLATLPAPPANGQTWNIPVAGFGSSDTWTFQFAGAETQELPAGAFSTWKLVRHPKPTDDQTVELWFAPDFHHLPVRIRLSQPNGDLVDQRLSNR